MTKPYLLQDEKRIAHFQRLAWRDHAKILTAALDEATPYARSIVTACEAWAEMLRNDPLAVTSDEHEQAIQCAYIDFRKSLVGTVNLSLRERVLGFPSRRESAKFFADTKRELREIPLLEELT